MSVLLRRAVLGCEALVLLGVAASAAVLLGMAGYLAWLARWGLFTVGFSPLDTAFVAVPSLATVALFIATRRSLARGRGRAHLALAGMMVLMLPTSYAWFSGPMHDIAGVFGSHGRFGCTLVNEDGTPYYFLTDSTLPWLIFAPALVGVAGEWLLRRRVRAGAQTDSAP